MDLDFNACLSLLIIGFVMALVVSRCLLAVVNRGFLLVDYAKEQLYGKKGGKGGKFNLMQEAFSMFKPQIQGAIQGFMGGKKPV